VIKYEHISRQIDLIPVEILNEPITIIGAGSIGSFAALALAKMGFHRLTVIDHDKVDTVNMSCQFHGFLDIGEHKVTALKKRIEEITLGHTKVTALVEKWEGRPIDGIVVAAVDSMSVRKHIWDVAKTNFKTKFIVDARMGAELALLYTMNPHDLKDREDYPKSLYSDDASEPVPCTQKSTTHCAVLLGATVAQAIKDCLMSPLSGYPRTIEWSIKGYSMQAWLK
jgi:hypothetical protein